MAITSASVSDANDQFEPVSDMQEDILIPFAIPFMAVIAFTVTLFLGGFWCGWKAAKKKKRGVSA
jgi:hypothetical protein